MSKAVLVFSSFCDTSKPIERKYQEGCTSFLFTSSHEWQMGTILSSVDPMLRAGLSPRCLKLFDLRRNIFLKSLRLILIRETATALSGTHQQEKIRRGAVSWESPVIEHSLRKRIRRDLFVRLRGCSSWLLPRGSRHCFVSICTQKSLCWPLVSCMSVMLVEKITVAKPIFSEDHVFRM